MCGCFWAPLPAPLPVKKNLAIRNRGVEALGVSLWLIFEKRGVWRKSIRADRPHGSPTGAPQRPPSFHLCMGTTMRLCDSLALYQSQIAQRGGQ